MYVKGEEEHIVTQAFFSYWSFSSSSIAHLQIFILLIINVLISSPHFRQKSTIRTRLRLGRKSEFQSYRETARQCRLRLSHGFPPGVLGLPDQHVSSLSEICPKAKVVSFIPLGSIQQFPSVSCENRSPPVAPERDDQQKV